MHIDKVKPYLSETPPSWISVQPTSQPAEQPNDDRTQPAVTSPTSQERSLTPRDRPSPPVEPPATQSRSPSPTTIVSPTSGAPMCDPTERSTQQPTQQSTPEVTMPSKAGQTSQRSSSSESETCDQGEVAHGAASDDAGHHTDPDATIVKRVDSNSDYEHSPASNDRGAVTGTPLGPPRPARERRLPARYRD